LTGFAQLLGGRVKTLHPVLYAGILSQESDTDQADRTAVGAPEISLVVVNLYDFEGALNRGGETEELIEAIDIGGVSLIRAAAKNYTRVLVMTDPDQYSAVVQRPLAQWTIEERRQLAARAFQHMAYYDAMIGNALADSDPFGRHLVVAGQRHSMDLRYGENPQQAAAWYRSPSGLGLADATLLQGKALSYNNVLDAEAAWALACELHEDAVVAVKHQMPCGVAVQTTALESYTSVYNADPISIFGGIVAVRASVDQALASRMVETFLEVVVAPDFSPQALAIFAKKKNLRLLQLADADHAQHWDLRMVAGGFLIQEADRFHKEVRAFERMAGPPVPEVLWKDIELSWKTAAYVRSNAIVIARGGSTVGIGGGETNRIDAARHALERAGDRASGAVLASDGFFPFGDVVTMAAKYQISVVVEPGGAMRDEESLKAAEEAGLTLLFTGERHFRH
jgi:phosphoribosylaminoimidazolecarboxamide formyltransferase/IMP cyclohydrolase